MGTASLEPEARAAVRRAWMRASWSALTLTAVAGVLVLVFFAVWLSPWADGRASAASIVVFSLVFATFVIGLGADTVRRDRRRFRVVEDWIDDGCHPGGRGWAVVLNEPRRQALSEWVAWAAGSVLFALVYTAYERDGARAGLLLIGALLAGSNVAAGIFFLTEHALRPATAVALASAWPEDRLGVRRRLLVAWATGSGIPLLGIGLALVWHQVIGGAYLIGPLWSLVITGLVAGGIVIGTAARLMADSIETVRTAVGRVGGGDLGVVIDVDDTTEMGQLQAGVNQMVAGLRERHRVQDLLGRYVGVDVAGAAIARPDELTGVVRDVSVLFVDLVGSTPLARQLLPTEIVGILNAFFAAVVEITHGEGGSVNRFEGDGALCLFGAPTPSADHADRALRVARGLRAAVAGLAGRYPTLDAGIGVSSGLVVAGNVGAADRYEYTVIGDPVNEAARLTEVAKGHRARTLATHATLARAGGESAGWTAAGTVTLRGRDEETRIFAPRRAIEVRGLSAAGFDGVSIEGRAARGTPG